MFKRHCIVTLPTDLVMRELVAATNRYCDEKKFSERLSVYDASRVIVNAIYDILYTNAPFVLHHNTAEDLLRELLPWYRIDSNAAYYYPNVFDAVFHSTEQLVMDLVDRNPYDVWDVRMLRHLNTYIAYLGDHRVLEWEKQNRGIASVGDVWVSGEETPRLRGSLVVMGYYRHLLTGKPVTDIRRITGDIVDYYGNLVLTTDDINRGIVVN